MIRSIAMTVKNAQKVHKSVISSTFILLNQKSMSLTHKIQYQVLQNASRLQTVSIPQ